MENNKIWIDGKWISAESGKMFSVLNPTTEEELGKAPLCDEKDVDKAVQAAVKAYKVWSKTVPSERVKILNRIAVAIRENADELINLDVNEHGTPIKMARKFAEDAAYITEYTTAISRALMGDVIPALHDTLSYLQRVPIGVCASILPWNGPFLGMVMMSVPPLATGNTCVIKPPSINSLIGLKYAEIFDKAGLPPGAVNIVTGPGGSVGNALASHPDVDLVRFTGSSETGKAIMSAASPTVKKLIMELGGNNPVIVLDDADVDHAVKSHALRHFGNTAQNCSTPGRYYVHQKVYDEFIDKFVSEVKKIVVGDPRDEKTTMGPMTNPKQRDKVEYYIQSAREEGARIVLGGGRPTTPPLNKGYFLMPTVVVDVTHDMTIAREEIFGPAACILKFSSDDDVIEMANDTRYGLCAVVWTKDMAKGMRFIDELNVDSVYLNMPRTISYELPWGGNVKESGVCKDGAVCGLEEFTNLKLVCVGYGK
ncbi:MAG: aldehyde dehydrogenase [Deltaproteobacteria bacterium]|nr:aldehyde dehydrogenase [Deltaproteobacteria bacterium]